MTKTIRLKVNGRPITLDTDEDRTLLWVLRGDLELTGTKYGCGEGICGSCTVLVDGEVWFHRRTGVRLAVRILPDAVVVIDTVREATVSPCAEASTLRISSLMPSAK